MANEINNFSLDAGLNVTAKVFAQGGAQEGSDVTMSEVGSGNYTGDFSLVGVSNGVYGVVFYDDDSGAKIGEGELSVKDNAEVNHVTLATDGITAQEVWEYATRGLTADVTTDTASREASKANVSGLSTFNPATDTVAHVTLVDTTTTNSDMRGTDSANTVAPDNASITAILADTNELQLNQGNWTTATGFTVVGDLAPLATEVNATSNKDAVVAQGDSAWTTATGFSTFNPSSDVVAHVTLVDTTTTNTDMRGTDGANTVAPDNATITLINDVTSNSYRVDKDTGDISGSVLNISKSV